MAEGGKHSSGNPRVEQQVLQAALFPEKNCDIFFSASANSFLALNALQKWPSLVRWELIQWQVQESQSFTEQKRKL